MGQLPLQVHAHVVLQLEFNVHVLYAAILQ